MYDSTSSSASVSAIGMVTRLQSLCDGSSVTKRGAACRGWTPRPKLPWTGRSTQSGGRCRARLTWPRTIVGCLLPLCAIVTTLFSLNLERAVFNIMGGFRQPTANDGAYLVLFLLTYLSVYALLPLLAHYLALVVRERREAWRARRAAA